MLYDAHNHIQREPLAPHLPAMERELRCIGLAKAVVNGTCEADWDRVSALAELVKLTGYALGEAAESYQKGGAQ